MKTTNYGFCLLIFFAVMQHPRHRVPAVSFLIGDNVMIKQGVGQLTHLLLLLAGLDERPQNLLCLSEGLKGSR